MKTRSLVSVLMPAYNHEKYVGSAIESVLAQSYPNIELIICDDCSDDATPSLIQKFADKYPQRIQYHKGRVNRGVSNRFNLLCGMARGHFIAPFASDDILPADAIEKRVDFLDSMPEIDIVATDIQVVDSHEKLLGKSEQLKAVSQFNQIYKTDFNRLYDTLLRGNFIPAGTLCIRMERVDKSDLIHDERCPDLHDYDTWLRLSSTYRWGYLDYPTYIYRWHGENLSAPKKKDIQSHYNGVAQMSYILSKQLLGEQSIQQRSLTIKHLFDCHRAISGLLNRLARDNECKPSMATNNSAKISAFMNKAQAHMDKNELKQACDTLIQILDIEPSNVEAVQKLGLIAMKANNTKQATYFFDLAKSMM